MTLLPTGEFISVNLFTVYILPSVNDDLAKEELSEMINIQMSMTPDKVFIVTGDFNSCRLNSSMGLNQQITGSTKLLTCFTAIREMCKD